MPTREPSAFDASKPLVMARFGTLNGHDLTLGSPITVTEEDSEAAGNASPDLARTLWASGTFDYAENARPTPVESPEDAAERATEVDDLDNGWFLLRAPWLGEGERVHGKDALAKRRAEVVAAGVKVYEEIAEGTRTTDIDTPAQPSEEVPPPPPSPTPSRRSKPADDEPGTDD